MTISAPKPSHAPEAGSVGARRSRASTACEVGPSPASFRFEGPEDRVCDHPLVLLARPRLREVDAEDLPECVPVRHAEEAERADHHVNVDRVGGALKLAFGSAPLEQ